MIGETDPAHDGETVRRQMLGDEHVDRAAARATDFDRPFQEHITASVWGALWTRTGLDRRTRSCITVALLAALGHHDELAMHVRAARRLGVSEEEIGEVLLHTSAYAGVPAGNSAFAVAKRALTDP